MVYTGQLNSDFLKLEEVDDKAKLNLINYAATDFLSLREALVQYIEAVYPLDYNYFAESDLGMMLVELVAYMGHILSYKTDFLANESFLKTARMRDSVKKLVQLIGVKMRGPLAAAADARITVSTAMAENTYITLPAKNRVTSVPSAQDGILTTFTLYKVSPDGSIGLSNSTGDIRLDAGEANSNSLGGKAIFENLVLLEGALVVETGTFLSTEELKEIPLSRSPIIDGSVQVFIAGDFSSSGPYKYVDNFFYASGSEDKVFQLISLDNFAAKVVFGDTSLGKSPAVGSTYTVIYRVGGGSRGNIRTSYINSVTNCNYIKGNDSTPVQVIVENISQGTGGSDAETIAHVKKYAPLSFRSQHRLVTLLDYKAFANSFISSYGSVGKANALVRRAYSSANIIDVYVLEKANNIQLRRATPQFKMLLSEAINELKMMTDEVIIVDGLIRTLDLDITLKIDKKYQNIEDLIKTKARSRILDYFNVDNSEFGGAFVPQELLNYLFDIDEIRFGTVNNILAPIQINFNEIIQLNNFTIAVSYV